jgi:SAM-dependent methyltransferase
MVRLVGVLISLIPFRLFPQKFFKIGLKIALRFFPIGFRKQLALIIGKGQMFSKYSFFSIIILSDYAKKDPDSFHRFLWANHLGYAKWYEENNDFGSKNLRPIRRMLFEDLKDFLIVHNVNPAADIKSVFDVGCSSGFLLRFMETDFFMGATVLEGNDIDGLAIERGKSYLSEHSSKIRLIQGDIANLDYIIRGLQYDLIFCTGVLLYLQQVEANIVIRSMLKHCNHYVVISSLANPMVDNAKLIHSEVRALDGGFIHNIDAMVENEGGIIEYRRWEGAKTFGGQSVYFVVCKPGNRVRSECAYY